MLNFVNLKCAFCFLRKIRKEFVEAEAELSGRRLNVALGIAHPPLVKNTYFVSYRYMSVGVIFKIPYDNVHTIVLDKIEKKHFLK